MVKKTILFILLFGIIFLGFKVSDTEAVDCIAITPSSPEADKNFCRNELAQIEAELADLLEKQKEQAKNTGTLTGDVNYLNSQIKALQTKIKARGLAIAQLRVSISQKASRIETLNERIDKQHDSLAQLLRNTNDFDNQNLVYLVLSNSDLSDFYHDIESYSSLKQSVKESVDQIRGIRKETEAEKQALEEKRNEETDAKVELETSQKKVSQSEAEKKKLLAISKQKETEYKKLAADKKIQADKIRAALIQFQGSGISSRSITFGEAYNYAKNASAKTGVRAALVLAIMQQETGFGNNVGGCYVIDLDTGDGKSIKTGIFYEKVMMPSSLKHFKQITENLGLNINSTPVSCPIDIKRKGTATKYYEGRGYGGAMGYTQFIPSTWMLVEQRVRSYLGITAANPWNPEHAVMATAIHLRDLGANKQTYTAERNAACKYYGSCADYADSVMKKTTSIQSDIEKLEGF